MRSETELRELIKKIDRLTGFVSEFGPTVKFAPDALKGYSELCGMSDGLGWVLGELPVEEVESGAIADLMQWAKIIEERSGKKLDDYE